MKNKKLFISLFCLFFSHIFIFSMRISEKKVDVDDLKKTYGEPFKLQRDSGKYLFFNNEESYNFFNLKNNMYFLEKESKGVNVNKKKMLLNYLINSKLDRFLNNLKEFILNAFSYNDFYTYQPGRSLYYFFMGFLSVLKENKDFEINVSPYYNKKERSFESKFLIKYKEKKFLVINIFGFDEDIVLDKEKREKLLFIDDKDLNYSLIKIVYNKKRVFYNFYKFKSGLGKNNYYFANPEQLIKTITDKKFVKDLWKYYKKDEKYKINSEKDFHLFILGLLANVSGIKNLSSNIERGLGRPDIIFKRIIEKNKLEKYIIELKASKRKKYAENLIDLGIKQIINNKYEQTPSATAQKAKKIHMICLSIDTKNSRIFSKQIDKEIVGITDTFSRKRRRLPKNERKKKISKESEISSLLL